MISFLPGHVEHVFADPNYEHPLTDASSEVGKILISPYSSDRTSATTTAIPLLRGVQDSITRGDLVLYTNIGGKTFYLGPVNTRNQPSNSSDHLYTNISTGKDRPDGYNKNISKILFQKMIKPRNLPMDFPAVSKNINVNTISYLESTMSDLMFEGRYGNAIRIGATYDNPVLIISNNNEGEKETLGGGGSIFAMTSIGTIDNNFPTETHKEIRNNEEVDVPGFRLSADSDGLNIGRGNYIVNPEKPEDVFNYSYGKINEYNPNEPVSPNNEFDQIIISSDRLIFNSTIEDITISSNRNINFGSNKNFTINNKGFIVFRSPNIYIGEGAKERNQPLVLGNELQQLLVRILRLLADAQALGDMNVPQKLTLFPNIHVAGTLAEEVNKIMTEFNLGELTPGQTPIAEYERNLDQDGVATSDIINGQAAFLSNRYFVGPNITNVNQTTE